MNQRRGYGTAASRARAIREDQDNSLLWAMKRSAMPSHGLEAFLPVRWSSLQAFLEPCRSFRTKLDGKRAYQLMPIEPTDYFLIDFSMAAISVRKNGA
jgi:hypothetical protein